MDLWNTGEIRFPTPRFEDWGTVQGNLWSLKYGIQLRHSVKWLSGNIIIAVLLSLYNVESG